MTEWIAPLLAKLAQGMPVVRMVVASVRGSAPREAGATLLFWQEATGKVASMGTIGGGHLEFNAMQVASYMLGHQAQSSKWQRFVLGASLGQCCGGVVELYWERFDSLAQAQDLVDLDLTQSYLRYCLLPEENANAAHKTWLVNESDLAESWPDLPANSHTAIVQAAIGSAQQQRYFIERLHDTRQALWIYGAGHVGSALVQVLQALPFRITWVDSRPEILAQAMQHGANNVTAISDEPHVLAANAPAAAWHVVMTHSHDEDMQICEALLQAHVYGFLGLIGSNSKATRFRQRLLHKGFAPKHVDEMHCPIGMAGVNSKLPSAIAVSVAFQLLLLLEQGHSTHPRPMDLVIPNLMQQKLSSKKVSRPQYIA